MSDFLDRFGDQLRTAQIAAQSTPGRVSRWLTRRRAVVASFVALLVAGPALAITQPWNPSLGRPGIDAPSSTDRSPVADSARSAMAVLRRPQTAADREKTAPLLKGIVGDEIQGVQVDSIRSVADGWALVPAKTVRSGPASNRVDQLCFTNAVTTTCGPAAQVRSAGIAGSEATSDSTTFTGLVPDGVVRVRFVSDGGKATTAAVSSNFFELRVPEVAPERMIDAPDGLDAPARIPAPPLPVAGVVQWLDADGHVVGPASR